MEYFNKVKHTQVAMALPMSLGWESWSLLAVSVPLTDCITVLSSALHGS